METPNRPKLTALFVYGTLRDGQPANVFLGVSAVKLGTATIRGRMEAYSDNVCPIILPGPGRVVGEVWLIDEARIPRLDEFEQGYKRRAQLISYRGQGHKGTIKCWIYWYLNRNPMERPRVSHGDWVKYQMTLIKETN